MRPTMAFADLDGTLISSRRMLERWGGPATVCVEEYAGAPSAHVTERAAALIAEMNRHGRLVPVTTRTLEQYRRIRLPGPRPPVALCANGAVLLLDGVPDQAHARQVQANLRQLEHRPTGVAERLVTTFGERWGTARVRVADDYFCYVVFDTAQQADRGAHDLTGLAEELGWKLSLQGRKCYLVPSQLTKGHAVRSVVERLGWSDFVAAGDAVLDLEMLTSARAAVVPAHSEMLQPVGVERVELPADTVVTRGHGAHAAEEIARWLAHQVGARVE